jgi:hypothetical protein
MLSFPNIGIGRSIIAGEAEQATIDSTSDVHVALQPARNSRRRELEPRFPPHNHGYLSSFATCNVPLLLTSSILSFQYLERGRLESCAQRVPVNDNDSPKASNSTSSHLTSQFVMYIACRASCRNKNNNSAVHQWFAVTCRVKSVECTMWQFPSYV